MYERLSKVEEDNARQDLQLDDHGNRIIKLEKADLHKGKTLESLVEKIADIDSNFTRMENTILKSAQATQEVLSNQNSQQWKLIEMLNTGNQDEKVRKHEITKTKLEKFWEWFGKLSGWILGSGGVLYVLLEMASK